MVLSQPILRSVRVSDIGEGRGEERGSLLHVQHPLWAFISVYTMAILLRKLRWFGDVPNVPQIIEVLFADCRCENEGVKLSLQMTVVEGWLVTMRVFGPAISIQW
jgi:hypothetical protein